MKNAEKNQLKIFKRKKIQMHYLFLLLHVKVFTNRRL